MDQRDSECTEAQSTVGTASDGSSDAALVSLSPELLVRFAEYQQRKRQQTLDDAAAPQTEEDVENIEAQISTLLKTIPDVAESITSQPEASQNPPVCITELATTGSRPEAAPGPDLAGMSARPALESVVTQIKTAAATIGSLVEKNEALRARGNTAISLIRAEIRTERDKADDLQRAIDDLTAKHARTIERFERSFGDVKAQQQALADQLSQAETELEAAMRRLDAVHAQITSTLNASIMKARSLRSRRVTVA